MHWDLNLQETYYMFLTANRLEYYEPLFDALTRNLPALINNVPMAWMNDSAAAPSGASSLDFAMSCCTLKASASRG